MNNIIAVLAVAGAVVYAQEGTEHPRGPESASKTPEGPRSPGGREGLHKFPLPPYLQNVTKEAKEEYFSIMRSNNLTLAQQKNKIQEWGKKNKIEASFGLNFSFEENHYFRIKLKASTPIWRNTDKKPRRMSLNLLKNCQML
ncbi:unnamed protein product [Strongylus vulgaris]|uniref:SXP/RAL-2 family protein Ani s 5-like cation-binding domain-containing protein n=1 Tax=Strongylus vulgaris TaxID=40348 RepID=A0A3P7JPD1_STRVU|nr:unnamed protein product [Strongylus vulgaris]